MKKEDILNYLKGYYRTTRQTKNGLFIYSGIKTFSGRELYTYVSNEDIGCNYNEENKQYLIEGFNSYINEYNYYKSSSLYIISSSF